MIVRGEDINSRVVVVVFRGVDVGEMEEQLADVVDGDRA